MLAERILVQTIEKKNPISNLIIIELKNNSIYYTFCKKIVVIRTIFVQSNNNSDSALQNTMNTTLRHIVSVLLAIVVLFSTAGFTVSKHYCGNELVSLKVNSATKDCCDGKMDNCCHNEKDYFQLKQDFVKAEISHNIQITDFSLLLPLIFQFSIELGEKSTLSEVYIDTSPPLLSIQTRLSLLQTYLC